MRRLLSLALALVFAATVTGTAQLVAQTQVGTVSQSQTGTVRGMARWADGNPVGNEAVRLRNVRTGEITARSRTTGNGSFTFTNVPPGSYVVEVVDSSGRIIAMSGVLPVLSGAVTTVTVTAAAGTAAAAAAGGAGLFAGTSRFVIAGLLIAGIAIAVIATRDDASPSR